MQSSSSTEPRLRPDLPGDPNCPICHGLGYVRLDLALNDPDFGKVRACTCRSAVLAHSAFQKLYEFSNLDALSSLSFENFKPRGKAWFTEEQQNSLESAFHRARDFASDLKGWLFIQGGFGSGKTHLAAAIANQAILRGVPTLFLTVPDLLDWLRFSYDSPETSYEERFEEIRNIDLLVMDDFGTHNATSWAQEKLFQILNHRYLKQLPLVMTTNVDFRMIEGRIRSRLEDRSLVNRLMIKAPDYRKSMEEIREPDLSSFNYHKDQTLENFETVRWEGGSDADAQSLSKALDAAREYAADPDGWIVFTGGYGSGKTHLAAAIGNKLAEEGRFPVMVVTADLLDHLRAAFSPSSPATLDQRFDEVRNAPILILDDLSTQSATPWAKEKLFQLINHRYEARLSTVITTSLSMGDIDERIRIRLLDRRISRVIGITAPAYPLRKGKKTTRSRRV